MGHNVRLWYVSHCQATKTQTSVNVRIFARALAVCIKSLNVDKIIWPTVRPLSQHMHLKENISQMRQILYAGC